MRNLQATSIVVVLLLVVYGMNVLTEKRQEAAKQQAKQVQKEREAAEAAAAAKAASGSTSHGAGGAAAFTLPANSGPVAAPVKLQVFVNNTNSCHQPMLNQMRDVQKAYGDLLRLEWCAMGDPATSEKADRLQIGCESGLVIDGKIEHQVRRNGGKVLVQFRGLVGDKYKLEDIYVAINQQLAQRGRKPPATAIARARII